jgi:hypothetical protein
MHGNSHVVLFYEVTDFSELLTKMVGPVEGAKGV